MEVCQAIGRGLQKRYPQLALQYHPMADGGDGSLEVLKGHLDLGEQKVQTIDPLGRPLQASYFASTDTAFIELASASGLVLLDPTECNPLLTSTQGSGQMIAHALDRGCQQVYLFLGGSATNDAGMGISAALGCQFRDAANQLLPPNGQSLTRIQQIECQARFDFSKLRLRLLCDVNNPLHGPNGAAYVYAKQKGATLKQIRELDRGLAHYGKVLLEHSGVAVSQLPGSGAAGGIGASLVALFGAKLQKGFESLAELTGLEEAIQASDCVISGEGKLDMQTLQGKVIAGIAMLCRKHRKPLVLFVGKNELNTMAIQALGARGVFAVANRAQNLQDAMFNGATYLEQLAIELSL